MDWSKGNILKKIGLNPKDFVDMELSLIYKKPIFDLCKFEDFLISQFGETEKSIENLVKEHYPDYELEIKELFGVL